MEINTVLSQMSSLSLKKLFQLLEVHEFICAWTAQQKYKSTVLNIVTSCITAWLDTKYKGRVENTLQGLH